MNWNVFQWRSLKTRVTLFTLLIFLGSLWALSYFASRILHQDMERQLGEQQLSSVAMVAAQLNRELEGRLDALDTVSGLVAEAQPSGPAAVQSLLASSRAKLLTVRNWDIFNVKI